MPDERREDEQYRFVHVLEHIESGAIVNVKTVPIKHGATEDARRGVGLPSSIANQEATVLLTEWVLVHLKMLAFMYGLTQARWALVRGWRHEPHEGPACTCSACKPPV